MYQGVIMSGFGGQGIVSAGILLAYAGMVDGKYVTFFPAYGAEMRGGTANCSVVVSSEEVASPVVSSPDSVVAMNEPSLLHPVVSVVEIAGGCGIESTRPRPGRVTANVGPTHEGLGLLYHQRGLLRVRIDIRCLHSFRAPTSKCRLG